jgi:hypothetical protein
VKAFELGDLQPLDNIFLKAFELGDLRWTLTHDKSSHGLWPGELKMLSNGWRSPSSKAFKKMLSNGWRSPSSKAFTKCYPMAGDLQIQKLSQNVIKWQEISKFKSFHKCYPMAGDLQIQKFSRKCYPMVGDLPYFFCFFLF